MDKEAFKKKIVEQIDTLIKLKQILEIKSPGHTFLIPTIGNAITALTNLFLYLEGKNPYFPDFSKPFFNNLQVTMHRTFLTDLHSGVEAGLTKIIKDKNFKVVINRKEAALKIIERIKSKIKKPEDLEKEFVEILKLAGERPTFYDYLNSTLDSISTLNKDFSKGARIYYDGLSIVRNKLSHSDMNFSEAEKERLVRAKLGKIISPEGQPAMTFEGYGFLIKDAIYFFDTLYSHLTDLSPT